jgi:hypothetical protein
VISDNHSPQALCLELTREYYLHAHVFLRDTITPNITLAVTPLVINQTAHGEPTIIASECIQLIVGRDDAAILRWQSHLSEMTVRSVGSGVWSATVIRFASRRGTDS